MKHISYNWKLVGSTLLNFVFFGTILQETLSRIFFANKSVSSKDIIILILCSFFVAAFMWAVFLLTRKRYAIKISQNEIDFNLLGNTYVGKIYKNDVSDIIYNLKKKQILIKLKAPQAIIQSTKNPILRWMMKNTLKKEGAAIAFSSSLTAENITEIKMFLDYYGYSKTQSKLDISTLFND